MKVSDYYKPGSLKEALDYAAGQDKKMIFMAGGTDITVKAVNRKWYADHTIVDIGDIKELDYIRVKDDVVEIGSCTKLTSICESEIIKEEAPILAKACSEVGGPQIRNQGTIGGNIANACLAADAIPALCVLGASVKTVNGQEDRIIPVGEIMKPCAACLGHEGMCVRGCYYGIPAGKKTILGENELITEIIIPRRDKSYRYFYEKVGRKAALTMSDFTLAVELKAEGSRVDDLKISIGAALDKIQCEDDICSAYTGRDISLKDIEDISKKLSQKILNVKNVTDPIRYKSMVCEKLTYRTLKDMVFGDEA